MMRKFNLSHLDALERVVEFGQKEMDFVLSHQPFPEPFSVAKRGVCPILRTLYDRLDSDPIAQRLVLEAIWLSKKCGKALYQAHPTDEYWEEIYLKTFEYIGCGKMLNLKVHFVQSHGMMEKVNQWMPSRWDLSPYGIEIVEDTGPDVVEVILNSVSPDREKNCAMAIGMTLEPRWNWSGSVGPVGMSSYCDVVLTPYVDDSRFKGKAWFGRMLNPPWVDIGGKHEKDKPLSFISTSKKVIGVGLNYDNRGQVINKILDSDLDCDIYGDCRLGREDSRLKGRIENKTDGLSRYRRSIAIENCCNEGYSTEKLIDCFMTDTQPIYLGDEGVFDIFGNAMVRLDMRNTVEQLRALQDVEVPIDDVNNARDVYLRELSLPAMISKVAAMKMKWHG